MPKVALGLDTLQYDLSTSWIQLDDKTVLITIKPQEGELQVSSNQPFSVFINHQLANNNVSQYRRSIQSLFKDNSTPKQITITSKFGLRGLKAYIKSIDSSASYERPASFQNLAIIVWLFLATILIILWKTFPQTLYSYFNFTSLINFRTIEEGLTNLRATSLNNLFVYIFLSMLAAMQLLILHGQLNLILLLSYTGFIISILLLKILLLNLSSRIFNISGFAPNQFLSFIRILLMFFVISVTLLLILFLSGVKVSNDHSILTISIIWVLIIHTVLVSARLLVRGGFTAFHLFSYLCVSELIPTSLLVKILSLT